MLSRVRNLLRTLLPGPVGLRVDEPQALALHLDCPPGRFCEALALLVSEEAVLYWEGPAERHLAAWLRQHTLEPRPILSVGISPVADFYHLVLGPGVPEALARQVERPGAVRGGRVRLHMREGERVVLEWRPAFGGAPVLLSRSLPLNAVRAFGERTGATLPPD